MIVARNLYYANDGQADAVHRHRVRACEARERLGLPRGRVLRRARGASNLPDVVWECDFDDIDAYDRDMAALAASPEYEAIRAHMRTLIQRFERVLWAPADQIS